MRSGRAPTEYLTKPFDIREVTALVTRAVGGAG